MNGQAGPSVVQVTGSKPGALDKSQPARLLRHPNSKLSFAYFDPYVATPRQPSDLSKLSLDEERCRPKRIVIETIPGFGSSWRWVPGARKQEGVDDEGSFPRLIEICGQFCECSQEQWDIYKLDPLYDCYVRFPPALTVIALKDSVPHTPFASNGATTSRIPDILDDDGYESERMLVDDDNNLSPGKGKLRFRKRKPSPREPRRFDFSNGPPQPSSPEDLKGKRPAHVSFQSLRPSDEEENEYLAEDSQNRNTKLYTAKNQKRARTLSPESGKRAVSAHRSRHETMKQARRRQELDARREMRENHLLREVLLEVPHGSAQFNGNGGMDDIPEEESYEEQPSGRTSHGDAYEDDDYSEDPIVESRRRMAELNSDRNRERQREKQLGMEEARPSAKADHYRAEAERQRFAEEEKRRKEEEVRLHEERERALQREEQRRKRAELLAKVQRERDLRNEQWNSGLWSASRAIERYRSTCAFFDKARFSEDSFPLAFIDIPWPTLRRPWHTRSQDIDWQSTDEFFEAVKPVLRGQAYKDFLKQSLQRFHPDRWSSRNLFASVLDEEERNEIETAVNTISKALGALYADARNH